MSILSSLHVATPPQVAVELAANRVSAAAIEFRELLASHTDTYVNGPMTAAELVAAASK